MRRDRSPELADLLLRYCAAMVVLVVLAPLRPAWPEAWRLNWSVLPLDVVANVVLFVPLGFLGVLTLTRHAVRRTVLGCVLLTVALETAQQFVPGRQPSPIDVATNSLGGILGAVCAAALKRQETSSLAVRSALRLPLAGFLYLLTPHLWLAGFNRLGPWWTTLRLWPLALVGVLVAYALWRHRLRPEGVLSRPALASATGLWLLAVTLPTSARGPQAQSAVLLCYLAAVVLPWLAPLWWPQAPPAPDRRFERATVARLLPVLGIYLALLALVPYPGTVWAWQPSDWHGAFALPDPVARQSIRKVTLLLETCAAFALLGYALASGRSRMVERTLARRVRLLARAAAAVVAFELLAGCVAGQAASVVRGGLCLATAGIGISLYRAQLATARPPGADRRRVPRTQPMRRSAAEPLPGRFRPVSRNVPASGHAERTNGQSLS